MDYRIFNLNITDKDIKKNILKKIKFDELDINQEYDLSVEFFNKDLIEDSLNDNVSFEIKKKHYQFIRTVRNIFESNNIKVNKFYLMGTIINIDENNMLFSLKKTNYSGKSNIVWPCKEIFLFEDSKNKLDDLLFSNQISEEEYEINLEELKDELSIFENEEEHEYIN